MTGQQWLDHTADDVLVLVLSWMDARQSKDYLHADALRALLAAHHVWVQTDRAGVVTVYRDTPSGLGGDIWTVERR